MKKKIGVVIILGLILSGALFAKRKFYDPARRLKTAQNEVAQLSKNHNLKDGDLIFQTSLSGQSKAIQLATKSKYSHCGLIYKEGENFYVLKRSNR